MSNKTEITEFGIIGELEGEQIHYKEGKKEYGNYLRYKNKRDDYVKNFFKAINWKFVNKMYTMKVKTKLDESLQTKQILCQIHHQ